jgi:hypothetical protein
MKFELEGPSIPDILLDRRDAGRVVFLCGAGVSVPSGLPNFVDLTHYVIRSFDPPKNSEIMSAFLPWLDRQSPGNVPLDQIFNLLHLEYGKDDVNALVTQRLSAPLEETSEFGREHRLIKRISSNQNGIPQIVTTNFDRLFELGCAGQPLKPYIPPALPDLRFGSEIDGITYLHGRLVDRDSASHPYVLSSADFGRAYLSEGWATNFMRSLLNRYTVVLVGYQAEDPPIKYLLQGLNNDGRYDRSRLYAFDQGRPEDIEAKWRDRGVTAIAYANHSDFWTSMEAWAARADDARRWRASIIAKCTQNPKDLASYERGQVAHILRTVQGARLFAEADPAPHPEWVCVLDAKIRLGTKDTGYDDDAEVFDPPAVYGLDDDLTDISDDDRKQGVCNDDLLVWRNTDDNPPEAHRLNGRQGDGFEAMPVRLGHLSAWLSKSINSPILAWWAIRQNGLHPRLLQQFDWELERAESLNERGRHIWNLILEHHRDPRNRVWNGEWFDLKRRVNSEGWTPSVLREFRRVSTPRLVVKPPFHLSSKPPPVDWANISLREIGEWEVVFLERHNEDLAIPDNVMPQVLDILEDQLIIASGLLADIETHYFHAPTFYPTRDVDGREHVTNDAKAVTWFVQIFDRAAALWPELARAHATAWNTADRFFFRKLKLYALNKAEVFAADDAANQVLLLDQEEFWDLDVARELLFLLADRWTEFSEKDRNRLIDRVLAGPDPLPHWADEETPGLRHQFAARYARYLEMHGCDLTPNRSEQLAELIGRIPKWSDGWASSTVIERGSHSGWVGTDESPDVVLDLPASEVISRATEELGRDFGSFTERRPFTGLVKVNPRKALSALTIAGRAGDYPEGFWSALIEDLPEDIPRRLRRVFLCRLARLPCTFVVDLRHTLSRWIEQNLAATLAFDEALGWAIYDHLVDCVLGQLSDPADSGLGEVRRNGKIIQQSRRTLDHAINSPLGVCAEALFQSVPGEKQEAGSLIPGPIKSRLERLLSVPNQGSDPSVSISTRRLNWLMFVDPAWTTELLIPMLELNHPASEPAWNGFLHGDVPSPPLMPAVKPLLLRIFPAINGFLWDRDLSHVAAEWLGYMRIFHADEQGGLTQTEMRSVIRMMSDDTRNRFINWLGQVGQGNEDGWAKYVVPLINEEWPRERRYRTSASMRAWIGLLDDTGGSFPAVYDAVKKFLVPVETNDHPFYRFTRDTHEEKPITVLYPEETLDLMNRTTPLALTRRPYELPKVLALISQAAPNLTSDPRYLRMIDLIERS